MLPLMLPPAQLPYLATSVRAPLLPELQCKALILTGQKRGDRGGAPSSLHGVLTGLGGGHLPYSVLFQERTEGDRLSCQISTWQPLGHRILTSRAGAAHRCAPVDILTWLASTLRAPLCLHSSHFVTIYRGQ